MILFSVIIPTYNRTEQLAACLTSLTRQTLDSREWEVIVVNDGGDTDIVELIKELSLGYRIRCFSQENSGPAKARNEGVSLAEGKFIAFLDDDCEPDENWLTVMKKNAEPGVLVGGRTINKLEENLFSEASQLLVQFLYETFAATNGMFFTTNNLCVDKASFLKAGAFNIDFRYAAGEDREFSIRYGSLGHKLQYISSAIIYHSHDLSLKKYIQQNFTYGRSTEVFRRLLKCNNITIKYKISFYLLLVLYPRNIHKYSKYKKIKLMILLSISQISYIYGAIYQLIYAKIK